MSRRHRQGLSPSLFPFLAVLVCTLGTLILLLALVAQNATDAAEQNARAERLAQTQLQRPEGQPAVPRITNKMVQSMLEEERFRVEQLVAFRVKQTADLEDRRGQLAHLDDHLRRLRQQLKQLGEEVELAMSGPPAESVDDQQIEELRARIQAHRAAIEQLQKEARRKKPRVVIVPHKGPNGTDRRPVYLECTHRGVTIWPEGSKITMTQLEDATFSANPLDAALRAIRHHAMKHYGDTAPPYPLLVVRPDGIDAYAAARGAMRDWDDQFGYELVPADIELAYSKPDVNLKQRVELAILEAAANQHARHLLARRGMGTDRGSPLRDRGPRIGGRGGRMPTLSAAALDRAGRSNGFRSHRDDYAVGAPQLGQSPHPGGSPYTAGSPYGPLQGDTFTHNPHVTDRNGAAERRLAQQMRAAAGEMRDRDAGGDQGQSQVDPARRAGQTQSHELPSGDDRDPTRASSTGEGTADGTPQETDPSAATKLTDKQQSPTAKGSSQPPASGDQAQPAGEKDDSATRANSLATSVTAQPGCENGSDSNSADAGSPPPISADLTPQRQLVRRQGRNWALPPEIAGIGGNAIVRSIRVECYPDRFVLLPSSTGGGTAVFGLSNGDVERATLRLATAVRDRVRRWGPALPGGRWQPRLDVIVMPRGDLRFHQLRTLMNGSGVEVTGRTAP